MDFTQAKQRIEWLKAVLWENSRKYYVENAPTMSDYEYDQLMHELEDLEAQYPQYRTADSPTQRVGSDLETPDVQNIEAGAGKEFAKYPHKYPMLSLGNTYSIAEVEEFAERATKTLETPFTWCCELKFDGTAICLTYRDGKLFRALTRAVRVLRPAEPGTGGQRGPAVRESPQRGQRLAEAAGPGGSGEPRPDVHAVPHSGRAGGLPYPRRGPEGRRFLGASRLRRAPHLSQHRRDRGFHRPLGHRPQAASVCHGRHRDQDQRTGRPTHARLHGQVPALGGRV